jgi:alpha-N-arabinofuranosidase
LIGGHVPRDTDPLDVYRDFMVIPDILAHRWASLQQQMKEVGIAQPHLAVTELQMFARLGAAGRGTTRLTHENLVNPATLAEALYDALIYHRAIELAPFVTMVTHSATVNHGGGLRKQQERVFANPCHHLQAAMAELAEAMPVQVHVESPEETAPRVLPDLKSAAEDFRFAAIDALAAADSDGTLWLSLVHRGSQGPIEVSVQVAGAAINTTAELRTLSADVPWAVNSLDTPDHVRPIDSTIVVQDSRLVLTLRPWSWVRVRIPTATR